MSADSRQLYERAQRVMPGGVNSPVRAFRAVGMEPLFIGRADGPFLFDAAGRRYIDYVCSWGPMILGHNHPAVRAAVEEAVGNGLSYGAPCEAEMLLAEKICMMAGIEMVRMVSSGTEAVMSALRLARAYTGRNKIVKFEGCYHGHADAMLVKAGSGAATGGVPDSAGVPAAVAADTLTARYNSPGDVRELFALYPEQIAAVIVEPVAANMGVVPPEKGFLPGLRELCDRQGALLLFDEVITGFRLAPGGAKQLLGITPDLVAYGKVIGGGMPVGAYGGRRELMELVAPLGPVYQAGTLSGNPVAMAAGLAQLSVLEGRPELYELLARRAGRLAQGMRGAAAEAGVPMQVNQLGSLCSAFFTAGPVRDYSSAKLSDAGLFKGMFAGLLDRGVYIAPSPFEAMFVSAAHSDDVIDETLAAFREALAGAGKGERP